jgi:4-amino-4-deoxy-L-arabinose transferase-like glycosyltransferase
MLETGNFIVPHLIGVPYIEKPPLLYWLMALSFRLFGISEASARLASAAPMLCLSIGLFFFCRRSGHQKAGFCATLVLATALPIVVLSRTVLFDPLLTALLGGFFLAFLRWYVERSRRLLFLCASLLALAVLAKGAVALVLAAGAIGTFLVLMRDSRSLRELVDPAAIGVFLLLAVPWHVAASWQQEDFAWFYFVNEHVLRFLGMREPHDYQAGPLFYYVPRVLIAMLPWTPLFWLLVRPTAMQDRVAATWVGFCRAWILFPLIFFSVSQAKATYYLLVAAPACALWIGLEIERRMAGGPDKTLARVLGMSMGLNVAALLAALLYERFDVGSREGIFAALAGVTVSAAAGILLVRWTTAGREKHWRGDAAVVAVAAGAIPALLLVLHLADARSHRTSSIHVAKLIENRGHPQPMVFVYQHFEDVFSTLPFYLGRPVRVIDSKSQDLQFGCQAAALAERNACISGSDFERYRARHPVAVVVRGDDVDAFRRIAGGHEWRAEAVDGKWVFFNF